MEQRCRYGRFLSHFLVFLLSISTTLAASDSQRLSKLKSLASSSKLISFNVDEFERFVEAAPRSYNLFVLLTAHPSICKPCGPMRSQLKKVISDFYSLSGSKRSSKPTFFAELQVSSSEQVFLKKYNVDHVPIFYAFKAGTSRSYPTDLSPDSLDKYPIQSLGLSPNGLKQFINHRSGSRMKVVRGDTQIPFVQSVRTFMPAIILFTIIAALICIVTEAYKNPMLWFFLIVLVYIFSVGGGHYSWIHNTPLAVTNNEGNWQYVAPGSRSQYVAEGFFVSATCVSISVLVILIQEMPSVIPDKGSQTFLGLFMLFMTSIAIGALLALYYLVSGLILCKRIANLPLSSPNLCPNLCFTVLCRSCVRKIIRKCRNIYNTARCKKREVWTPDSGGFRGFAGVGSMKAFVFM